MRTSSPSSAPSMMITSGASRTFFPNLALAETRAELCGAIVILESSHHRRCKRRRQCEFGADNLLQGLRDNLHLPLFKLGIHRQRKNLARQCFRYRQITLAAAKLCESLLQMQRHRVIAHAADAAIGQL